MEILYDFTIPGFRSEEQVTALAAALDAVPLSDIELARARELGRSWVPKAEAT